MYLCSQSQISCFLILMFMISQLVLTLYASWIDEILSLKSAHPSCKTPVESNFNWSENKKQKNSGFLNQSALFTNKEAKGTSYFKKPKKKIWEKKLG